MTTINESYCITENGNKKFYNNNRVLHNDNGPAVETSCDKKEWWINGKNIEYLVQL